MFQVPVPKQLKLQVPRLVNYQVSLVTFLAQPQALLKASPMPTALLQLCQILKKQVSLLAD